MLGYDNLDQIEQLITRRDHFMNLETDKSDGPLKEGSDEYYKNLTNIFIEISKFDRREAVYFLNRHNYNFNDALDAFY